MTTIHLFVASVALAASVLAGPQSRPDFSGRWTTEPESPPAAAPTPQAGPGRGGGRGAGRGDMGSGWGATITVRQTPPLLTVEYAFFGRGDMQPPLSFKYALDGTPTRNSVMMGRGIQVQTSTAAWEGETLVITTVYPFDDPSTGRPVDAEVRRTLSLAADGSLVVETLRKGVLGGPDTTTRVVYRKIG